MISIPLICIILFATVAITTGLTWIPQTDIGNRQLSTINSHSGTQKPPLTGELPPFIEHLLASNPNERLLIQDTDFFEEPKLVHDQVTDLLRKAALGDLSHDHWEDLLDWVMETLREHQFEWSDYPAITKELISNRSIDPVVREYVVRHLFSHLNKEREALDENILNQGLESFLTVLEGKPETPYDLVSKTALFSAYNLLEDRKDKHSAAYREKLGQLIIPCIEGTRLAPPDLLVACIRTATLLRLKSAIPAIRQYLWRGSAQDNLHPTCMQALKMFRE